MASASPAQWPRTKWARTLVLSAGDSTVVSGCWLFVGTKAFWWGAGFALKAISVRRAVAISLASSASSSSFASCASFSLACARGAEASAGGGPGAARSRGRGEKARVEPTDCAPRRHLGVVLRAPLVLTVGGEAEALRERRLLGRARRHKLLHLGVVHLARDAWAGLSAGAPAWTPRGRRSSHAVVRAGGGACALCDGAVWWGCAAQGVAARLEDARLRILLRGVLLLAHELRLVDRAAVVGREREGLGARRRLLAPATASAQW